MPKVVVIFGAGDGNGAAISRKFAKEGYKVVAIRRNVEKLDSLVSEIRGMNCEIYPYGVDCRKEEEVKDIVEKIEKEIGFIDVAVHNIGANVQFSLQNTTTRVFSKVWEMACLSGFLVLREVSNKMIERKKGTILISGATASVRGSAGFHAFASAKHGLRAISQSAAKELGPKGIHVCHIILGIHHKVERKCPQASTSLSVILAFKVRKSRILLYTIYFSFSFSLSISVSLSIFR